MKQKPDRRGIADRLRRAAIIIERDHIGGFEAAGRRIVDIAADIGDLIGWVGEGFDRPTGQGNRVTRRDKLAAQVPAHHSPALSEVPK